MNESDMHWLAGLLEGEGSFLKGVPSSPGQPAIRLNMTDEDVVARVAGLFGVSYQRLKDRRNSAWKPSYTSNLRGYPAILLMKKLRPLMGTRRQQQIDDALATWKPQSFRINQERAEAIIAAFRSKEKTAQQLADEYGISKWSVYALHQGRFFTGNPSARRRQKAFTED